MRSERARASWLVAAAVGLLLLSGRAGAQPAATAVAPKVDTRPLAERIGELVEREMQAQGLVGVSVAMARGGEVVFTGNWGFEDREQQVPAADATMYRWASVSKPMTAVVAMRLAKAGKLDLDADVREYVPEFPAKPFEITSRQLLAHQGGIVHYSNGPVIRTERAYEQANPFEDVVLALDMFKESPLVCEPGEKYSYTTHGYLLLGAVVQRAGNQKFADQVLERIARPAGMTTLRPDYQWEAIPRRAVGYKKAKDGAVERSTDTDVSWKLAGGGWISTCGDMARFGAAMLGEKLVDGATREQMWTDQPDRTGKPTGYGLGFGVTVRRGEPVVAHSGSQEKTATMLQIRPRDDGGNGTVVAIMCNTEGAKLAVLAWGLSEVLMGRPVPPMLAPTAPGGREPVPPAGGTVEKPR